MYNIYKHFNELLSQTNIYIMFLYSFESLLFFCMLLSAYFLGCEGVAYQERHSEI